MSWGIGGKKSCVLRAYSGTGPRKNRTHVPGRMRSRLAGKEEDAEVLCALEVSYSSSVFVSVIIKVTNVSSYTSRTPLN